MNQRIVINRCYGGFGLSNQAAKRYRELAWIPEEELFWTYDIPRDSKILLQVIDELGVKKTSGPHAELKVIEVPEGVKWHIGEYDGMEWIAEDHRQWGLDEYPKEQTQEEIPFSTISYGTEEDVRVTLEKVIKEHGELLSKIKD
jgi:hypothetical protein